MEDIHFGKICFLPSGCEPFSAYCNGHFCCHDGEISYTAKDYRWMDLFFGNHVNDIFVSQALSKRCKNCWRGASTNVAQHNMMDT
jgi:hypothetical protein